jgi:hypothetical protein
VQKFGAGAFVEDGTPPYVWPSPLDEAVSQHQALTSAERTAARRAGGLRLLTTKYRARKSVAVDIDGEKQRVRKGDRWRRTIRSARWPRLSGSHAT